MSAGDPDTVPTTLDARSTSEALATSAVVRWWQTTAFLEIAGPDAASSLDGLCTQAIERVAPGEAVLGLFLDAKAKLIAPATVHRIADRAWSNPRSGELEPPSPVFILETLPHLVEPLRAHLTRYRLRARTTIEPIQLASIAVVGERANDVQLPALEGSWTHLAGQAFPTQVFLGSAASCALLTTKLLSEAGFAHADPDAFEALRIERSVPSLHDLLPGRMPAEIGGMSSAVALDAGCYLGQEPVARLHYRGQARRTLRRFVAPAEIAPVGLADSTTDAPLELRRADDAADARPVGRLTTWARREDGSTVALGILRSEIDAGTPLVLTSSGDALAAIDAPPE